MWYMGGKCRQGKHIAAKLVELYSGEREYYEPFCGALGAAEKIVPALAACGVTRFVLSDISKALITMWRAVIYEGWIPPTECSEADRELIKQAADVNDPMYAFAGFGLSFGGKWWDVYARNKQHKRGFAEEQSRATLRKAAALRPYAPLLLHRTYRVCKPHGALVYLDPPYANRCNPYNCKSFDHEHFWSWAEALSTNNCVITTSYVAPPGWVSIHNFGDTVVRHHAGKGSDGTQEHIFKFNNKRIGDESNHR